MVDTTNETAQRVGRITYFLFDMDCRESAAQKHAPDAADTIKK